MKRITSILIDEATADNNTISAIKKWIKMDPNLRKCKIETPKAKTSEDEMGVDPTWLIEIVLGSTVLAELIKCIRAWKEASGSKVVIIIKSDNGEKYKIDNEKLEDKNQ